MLVGGSSGDARGSLSRPAPVMLSSSMSSGNCDC
jgi:hypothetical protein